MFIQGGSYSNADLNSIDLGSGPGFCLSYKLPGGFGAAGPLITLYIVRLLRLFV